MQLVSNCYYRAAILETISRQAMSVSSGESNSELSLNATSKDVVANELGLAVESSLFNIKQSQLAAAYQGVLNHE